MITVVKLNTQYQVKLRYQAEVIEQRPQGLILSSIWELPSRDLGCIHFEPGDRFVEYYYIDRWFDIQEVISVKGKRKGWYCDIAEPALIEPDQVRLVDLELDVWISAEGETFLLDEDEFAASSLTIAQRHAARQSVQDLLRMLEAREDAFANLRQGL